ncbi:MAG TPA: hypothetical protein PL001_00120 [Candidatus Kryptobacter bacterium]|nr:hypothetical protein [Candidatus Kryptobacter bacterium]
MMARELHNPNGPDSTNIITVETTTVVCDCGYSSTGNMEGKDWPNPWICPECDNVYMRDEIMHFRRRVSTETRAMRYMAEDQILPHERRAIHYVFEGFTSRMSQQSELERLRLIGAKEYIRDIIQRTKEMGLSMDGNTFPKDFSKLQEEAKKQLEERENIS